MCIEKYIYIFEIIKYKLYGSTLFMIDVIWMLVMFKLD